MWWLDWLACAPCGDAALVPVGATGPLGPGETRRFVLERGGRQVAFDACDGYFEVNGVQGGLAWLGTVDACGVYTAPASPPDVEIRLAGGRAGDPWCAWGKAAITLGPVDPPPPPPVEDTGAHSAWWWGWSDTGG